MNRKKEILKLKESVKKLSEEILRLKFQPKFKVGDYVRYDIDHLILNDYSDTSNEVIKTLKNIPLYSNNLRILQVNQNILEGLYDPYCYITYTVEDLKTQEIHEDINQDALQF
jgi:uncharacterized protein (UPF0248 family)